MQFCFQGLLDFIIEDVKMNVQTLNVNVTLSYESLTVEGFYDTSGKLFKFIPFSARGPFEVTTSNPKVIKIFIY